MENSLEKTKIPVHETLYVGMLLSIVGGFLEAYTYIFRGGVFCNAQTGNFVLMMIHAARGELAHALFYPIPILSFMVGIFITKIMRERLTSSQILAWEPILVAVELVLLFAVGFMPQSVPNAIPNTIVSFICSMQYNTFRKTKGIPYATTFCTNNLRLAAENLHKYVREKDTKAGRDCARYFAIILAFCIGVAAGTLLLGPLQEKAVWFCCGVLFLTLVFMLMRKKREGQSR